MYNEYNERVQVVLSLRMLLYIVGVDWLAEKGEKLSVFDVPMVYGFTAGMIALINPCGAAMLPAYIGYQLSRDVNPKGNSPMFLAWRGVVFGVVTTMGFIAVFGTIGTVIAFGGRGIITAMPYAGLATGIGVSLLAMWLLITRGHFGIIFASRISLGGDRGMFGLFLFGVGYALASLSCALPIFLVVVLTSINLGGIFTGLTGFLSYALGMGTMLILITVVVSFSQHGARAIMRRALPHMGWTGNLILLGSGLYITYYWTFGTGGDQFLMRP